MKRGKVSFRPIIQYPPTSKCALDTQRSVRILAHMKIAPLIILATSVAALADVRLPAIISDNMVLLQDSKANVWGWADAGEKVTVKLGESGRLGWTTWLKTKPFTRDAEDLVLIPPGNH